MAEERKERNKNDNNTIFIGGKPFMNYVTGVVMQFTTKGAREVIIRARGKFISNFPYIPCTQCHNQVAIPVPRLNVSRNILDTRNVLDIPLMISLQ